MPNTIRLTRGAALAALLAVGLLTGCTSQPASTPPNDSAAGTISSLGAVPIPSAPTGTPAPVTASPGHPQMLAMGAPVEVTLPNGARALVATTGPTENLPPGGASPGATVTGVITVTVTPSVGTIRLAAADLACRDETGAAITLSPAGAATVSASPGQPATLRLSGSFRDGDAQINWQQDGHVLAIWDFTIEID